MKTMSHSRMRMTPLALMAMGLAVPPALAAPANVVTAIRVEEGNPTRVIIEGSQDPTFTVFRLGTPPRVVVDMAGADMGHVKAPAESRDSRAAVAMVTTTQFKDPAHPIGRVTVGLNRDLPFDVKAEGRNVVVTIMPAVAPLKAENTSPAQDVTLAAAAPSPTIELEGTPSEKHATRLLSVQSSTRPGGAAVLTLKTDGPVQKYQAEEVQDPLRLVVDLYGIEKGPKKVPAFKSGPLSRVRLGKHEDHLRVVLDARGDQLPAFDVASTDEGVTVAFSAAPKAAPAVAAKEPEPQQPKTEVAAVEPAPAATAAPATPAPAAVAVAEKPAAPAPKRTRVEDVRFDEKDGFYRLRLSIKGEARHKLGVDNPRLKVLELEQAELPASLERSLDTTAYGGPVQSVATFHDPDRPGVVKVAVDLGKAAEHRVWTKGDTLYWDFRDKDPKPKAESNAELASDEGQTRAAGFAVEVASLAQQGTPAQSRYTGKKITIDLKDADILNVLRLIAEVSKLNIIASDEVRGTVTIKLRNVPWDQALDIILKVKGLGQEKNGNIVRVVPMAVLRAEKEARDKERERNTVLEPTKVKLLPVNYANAGELLPQISALLSPRGKATVDKRTNVIIVEDIPDNLFQAERLVRTLDTQTPQVLIEARIVEAAANYARNLGIQWGYNLNFSDVNGNPTGLIFPHNFATAGAADDPQRLGVVDPGLASVNNYAVNLPSSVQGLDSTALGFSFGSVGNIMNVNLRLGAAERDGTIKIVSSPKVTTLDNKTAKISQGVDIPVPRVSAAGTSTQLIPSMLELDVTPHVTADGSVLLKLTIRNNQPNFNQTVLGVPALSRKEADTEVMVHDGETTVVGGIYTRSVDERYRRSPFLGSLPVIGWLFKAQDKADDRKELLAFITPRIVNRGQAAVGNQEFNRK